MLSDETLGRVLPDRVVALTGDLIRALAWTALVGGAAALIFIYGRLAGQWVTRPSDHDFTILYVTVRLAADGLPMYGAAPSDYRHLWPEGYLGNLNPPHVQLLLLPLSWFSYRAAAMLWALASTAALFASFALVFRECGLRVTGSTLALVELMLASAPFVTVAVTGELTFLLLVPVILGWRAARRGVWFQAGCWFGACAATKLFLGLLPLYVVYRGGRRGLVGSVSGISVCVLAGVLAFGPANYLGWFTNLTSVHWWWLPMNASLQGLVGRTLTGHADATAASALGSLVRVTSLMLAAAVLGITAVRVVQERSRSNVDSDLLLLIVASLLVSPLGWIYYFPLMLGPATAVMLHANLRRGRIAAALAFLGTALFYMPTEVTRLSASPSGAATLASVYGWGALCAWMGLAAGLRAWMPAGPLPGSWEGRPVEASPN